MQKRKSKISILFAVSLITLCLVIFAASSFIILISNHAKQLYGAPTSKMTNMESIYMATLLVVKQSKLIQPVNPSGVQRTFDIQFGESTNSIINRLYNEGLIDDPNAFRYYLRYSGLDTGIQAGKYTVSPAMSPIMIAQSLQDPSPANINFTILAGWRIEEIAESLPTSGFTFGPELFLSQAHLPNDGFEYSHNLPPGTSLEGFFFPDTYTFERTISVVEFVQNILDNFKNNISSELLEGFHNRGLGIYQAVTLASIVEREAVLAEEMPHIASVYYNRLASGIKLDADPTVQYAIGYNESQNTWWTNPLSFENLAIDSPFNTYLHSGLPPGPIANPGLLALRAVAYPAQTTFYYFRATCDGSGKHVFAETYDEHINNACP